VRAIEGLEKAREIRCITLASPLDLFSAHRFLLTLLYWKADSAGGVGHVRRSLLQSQEVPSAVVEAITAEARSFDIFNHDSPFLQDPSLRGQKNKQKDKKSVGSLFAELSSGSNIAHFHHGDDENMRLCLPCATLGMLRVVPWSQAGGSGLTPSVHGAPPIMAIAAGDNLAMTLGLNLVPLEGEAGEPKWSGHFKPTDPSKPIPYLEALTWNPRRILLPAPQKGVCWYCGDTDVATVGPIVYKKNEETRLRRERGKRTPFIWQDPSAFYAPNRPHTTTNSANENLATSGRDLTAFLDEKNLPASAVVEANRQHQGWRLVIPSTAKDNKTFDHRELQLTSLSRDTIRSLVPVDRPARRQGLDGWKGPERLRPPQGIRLFFQAAVKLLTYADWAVLSNAAYRDMHDCPAAFDVLSGLYWGLRDRKMPGLPSRNVAWLTLKLMAAVPADMRVIHPHVTFCPLQLLPKRQINESGSASPYPVSFPRGPRLEAALRGALDSNMRKRNPRPVDWIGLCYRLDQLLD